MIDVAAVANSRDVLVKALKKYHPDSAVPSSETVNCMLRKAEEAGFEHAKDLAARLEDFIWAHALDATGEGLLNDYFGRSEDDQDFGIFKGSKAVSELTKIAKFSIFGDGELEGYNGGTSMGSLSQWIRAHKMAPIPEISADTKQLVACSMVSDFLKGMCGCGAQKKTDGTDKNFCARHHAAKKWIPKKVPFRWLVNAAFFGQNSNIGGRIDSMSFFNAAGLFGVFVGEAVYWICPVHPKVVAKSKTKASQKAESSGDGSNSEQKINEGAENLQVGSCCSDCMAESIESHDQKSGQESSNSAALRREQKFLTEFDATLHKLDRKQWILECDPYYAANFVTCTGKDANGRLCRNLFETDFDFESHSGSPQKFDPEKHERCPLISCNGKARSPYGGKPIVGYRLRPDRLTSSSRVLVNQTGAYDEDTKDVELRVESELDLHALNEFSEKCIRLYFHHGNSIEEISYEMERDVSSIEEEVTDFMNNQLPSNIMKECLDTNRDPLDICDELAKLFKRHDWGRVKIAIKVREMINEHRRAVSLAKSIPTQRGQAL